MLAIKFQRIGKKHQPQFRVVVAEKRSKLGGPPLEYVGSYNPFAKTASFRKERIAHWLRVGAQPTASVWNVLVRQGLVKGPKIAIKIRKKKQGEAAAATPAAASAAPEPEKTEDKATSIP